MTTFSTHLDLFRDTRLNFGYYSSAEMFKFLINNILAGLEGVTNVSDDIIIFGRTKEEHDERLRRVLEKLDASGLTANAEKCEFGRRSIEFFGLIFGENGVSSSPERVKALKSLKAT